MDYSRLSMPLGEAIFTQRSIRRFRADPIPRDDIHLIVEAAVKAPNGGNQQVARLLVVERSHFWRLLNETPDLVRRILVTLSRRVRRLEQAANAMLHRINQT